ncbi:MAG: hypothetical protein LBB65_08560 [Burkholderiales bacterium]|jgi:hypothetical protein|nr:hypothetical protein [Burkholderiales bacterium]
MMNPFFQEALIAEKDQSADTGIVSGIGMSGRHSALPFGKLRVFTPPQEGNFPCLLLRRYQFPSLEGWSVEPG